MSGINPISQLSWPFESNSQTYPFNKDKIASELWLSCETQISDEMVEKVNKVAIYLKEEGFALQGVLADGDCFLHAFLKSYGYLAQFIPLLDVQKDRIQFLRQQIAAKVELQGDVNNRAEVIKGAGEWITAMDEGDLLANALKVPIRIVTVQKDRAGCGINDMLTFINADQPRKEWKNIQDNEKPPRYIFIVDLGGHFVCAVPLGRVTVSNWSLGTESAQNFSEAAPEKTTVVSQEVFSATSLKQEDLEKAQKNMPSDLKWSRFSPGIIGGQMSGVNAVSQPTLSFESNIHPDIYDEDDIASKLGLNPKTAITVGLVKKVNEVAKYLKKEGFELQGVPASEDGFSEACLKSYSLIQGLQMQEDGLQTLRQQIAAHIKEQGSFENRGIEGKIFAIFDVLKFPIRYVSVQDNPFGLAFKDELYPEAGNSMDDNQKPPRSIFIVDLFGNFLCAAPLDREAAAPNQILKELKTQFFSEYNRWASIIEQSQQSIQSMLEKATEVDQDVLNTVKKAPASKLSQEADEPLLTPPNSSPHSSPHIVVDKTGYTLVQGSKPVTVELFPSSEKFELPGEVLQVFVLKEQNLYFVRKEQGAYFLCRKTRGAEITQLFNIQNPPGEIYISPSQRLIALAFHENRNWIEIYDVSGNKIYEAPGLALQFVSDNKWWVRDDFSRLLLIERKEKLLSRDSFELFFAEPSGRLLLTSSKTFPPSIEIHDLKTKSRYEIPTYSGTPLEVSFLSSNQVLLVFLDRFVTSIGKEKRVEVYDLQARRLLYHKQVPERVKVFTVDDKIFLVDGASVITDCIPKYTPHSFLIVNQDGMKLSINDADLLKIAYSAFKNVWSRVTHNTAISPKAPHPFIFKEPADWLRSAGFLSKWATSEDIKKPENDLWYYPKGASIQLADGHQVSITKDGMVTFPKNRNDYGRLADDFMQIAPEDTHTLEDVVKMMESIFSSNPWHPETNRQHRELAQILLKRIELSGYPHTFTPEREQLLDCFLVLVVGVESSRNNVTFLTTLLMLDLIAAGAHMNGQGPSYGFNNAFISGSLLHWNDNEQKDLGGTFPMATNSAGKGNFGNRIAFIQKKIALSQLLEDPQHNRIALAEMRLIVDWLSNLCEAQVVQLKASKNEQELEICLQKLFERRLQQTYSGNGQPEEFLRPLEHGFYKNLSPLRQHHEEDELVYYLTHTGPSNRLDDFYHRLDMPCQMLPGYAARGVKKTETIIEATLQVKGKFPNKLIRIMQPISLEKDKIPEDLKMKFGALLNDYHQWLITYFDFEAIFNTPEFKIYQGAIDKKLLKHVLSKMNQGAIDKGLLKHVLSHLQWVPVAGEMISSQLQASDLKLIMRNLATAKPLSMHPRYLGNILKEIQSLIDPLLDRGQMGAFVSTESTNPPIEQKLNKLYKLASKHNLIEDRTYWPLLYRIATIDPNFSYEMEYAVSNESHKKLKPCDSCYGQALGFPILPYVHPHVVALASASSRFFHRPESSCSQVIKENGSIFISEEVKEPAEYGFTLKFQPKKEPCTHCWLTFTVDRENDLKRARSPGQDDSAAKRHKVGKDLT